ncbi:MAG: hypothetical protein ACKOQW_00135 [Phycisphaerales bacterium]
MALELVYTSAERGLRAGTSGFCTVAMTRGLPPALVPRLEALGGYRPGPSGNGPKAHCFWRVETAGSVAHVLAVVGPAPPDHTQRTNKVAAYLVLGQDELVSAGPAWLLQQRGVLRDGWSGAPAWIEAPVRVPASGPSGPHRCTAWEAAAGDAGWAGVVASAFLRDQSKPIHVVWRDGMDPLALVGEVLSLMPDWARWRATFSTYFLQPVAGTPCALRFCLAGTPAAEAAHQSKGLVVDLTRPLGAAADSRFARMARTGIDEEAVARDAERARRAAQRQASSRAGAGGAAAGGSAEEIGLEPAEELPQAQAVRAVRTRVDDEVIEQEVDDRPRVDAMRVRITVTAVTGVLLILVLGAVIYGVTAYRSMIGSSISEVTDGPKLPPIEMPAESQPLATEPPVTPEVAQPEQPAPEPAPEPEPTAQPDPTPEPAPMPATEPTPEPSAPGVSPADPAEAPAPRRSLPTGMIGARWVMQRDATPGGTKAPLRWSVDVDSRLNTTRVAFQLPEELSARGVEADGPVLTIAGSGFRVRASLDGRRVVAASESWGTMPVPLAEALGQEAGTDTIPAWSALMAVVTIELTDASGTVVGQAQCRASQTRGALAAGAPAAVVPAAPALLLVAQVIADPGAPTQRRVITQGFVEPGGSCTLSPTELLQVHVDRSAKPDALSVRASILDAAEVGTRAARITEENGSIDALLRQVTPLRQPVTGAALDSGQVTALDAAWAALSDEERARIAPDAPDRAPRTASTVKAVLDVLDPRLRARKDVLLRELAELRPREWKLPDMFLRVSTPDGAIVLERPLSLGPKR